MGATNLSKRMSFICLEGEDHCTILHKPQDLERDIDTRHLLHRFHDAEILLL